MGEGGDQRPRNVLAALIEEHGPDVVSNRLRCRGLLLDSLGAIKRTERPEVAGLLTALDDGVAARLASGRCSDPAAEAAALAERTDLTKAEAVGAIEAWAGALGSGPRDRPDLPPVDAQGAAVAVTPVEVTPVGPPPPPPPPPAADPVTARTTPPASAPATPARRRRHLLIAAAVGVGLVLAALLVPPAMATRGAHVAFQGGRVAVFRGGPDGFLWAGPEIDRRTAIERQDVDPSRLDDLEDGQEFDDLDEAEDFVDELEAEADQIRTERAEEARREEARTELERFSFVREGSCTEAEVSEGEVLSLQCTSGEYTAWFTAWDSAEDLEARNEVINGLDLAQRDRWNDRDGIDRGTLITFSFADEPRIYWTYDDEGPFPLSVEGLHERNDMVELRYLWEYDRVGFDK